MTRHGSARGPGHRSAREVPAGDGHHAWAVAGPATEPPTQPLAVVTADGPGHERDAAREAGRDHHAPRNEHGHGREAARDHAPGNEHGHGHGPAAPAGRRVRVLLAALLVPCALAALVGLVVLRPTGGRRDHRRRSAAAAGARPGDGRADHGLLPRRRAGPLRRARRRHVRRAAGRAATWSRSCPLEPGTPRFTVGDPVVLGWSGGDPDDPGSYQIVDFQRGGSLVWLAVLFAAAVLVLGRWRGLAALAALVVSFAVLLLFVLPAILDGRSPLAVAVVGSGVIMFAVLYLTHGLSARTSTAVLGTLVSLALIGAARRRRSPPPPGSPGWTTRPRRSSPRSAPGVDARGLLLAGMVIGALGVLDDVTVTQTSAVWELRRANPQLGARALFPSAMRIGRDHVASAVNTLVLAYAGASLPLLLLFSLSGRSLGEVATSQDVATEIVRTLVGSIGLVASVPVTTAVAALVASREDAGTGRTTGRASVASPSPSRSSSTSSPLNAARSSPGGARNGPGPAADLGQHGHREQPARGERRGEVAGSGRGRGTAGTPRRRTGRRSRRQPAVEVVGDPADPLAHPVRGGQPGPGREPGRRDVDGVDGEPAPGQPHGDPAPPAGHVQGAPRGREAGGELGRARHDGRWSRPRRPRSGVARIPACRSPVSRRRAHASIHSVDSQRRFTGA